ncbi:MAG: fumarylacetoacetase [Bacteroidia bacterium]|jgi:fumarylacetoacetase
MSNWLQVPDNHDFSIHNLPYGIFMRNQRPTPGVAIGGFILDLRACANLGLFSKLGFEVKSLESDVLNDFIECGKPAWTALRAWMQESLTDATSDLNTHHAALLVDRLTSKMCLPIRVGDYTDFYSSIEHATNVGMMFRDPANALLPNWRHLPVGYHGRSSSIVVSGTDIKRPHGQTMPPDATAPVFGPSKRGF